MRCVEAYCESPSCHLQSCFAAQLQSVFIDSQTLFAADDAANLKLPGQTKNTHSGKNLFELEKDDVPKHNFVPVRKIFVV